MSAHDQTSSPPTSRSLAAHGVVRGHAVGTVETLRARLAAQWTLSSLAEEVHLSRSQLVRAFDTTVGISPMAYLRQIRVEQMAQLLQTSSGQLVAAEWHRPSEGSLAGTVPLVLRLLGPLLPLPPTGMRHPSRCDGVSAAAGAGDVGDAAASRCGGCPRDRGPAGGRPARRDPRRRQQQRGPVALPERVRRHRL